MMSLIPHFCAENKAILGFRLGGVKECSRKKFGISISNSHTNLTFFFLTDQLTIVQILFSSST